MVRRKGPQTAAHRTTGGDGVHRPRAIGPRGVGVAPVTRMRLPRGPALWMCWTGRTRRSRVVPVGAMQCAWRAHMCAGRVGSVAQPHLMCRRHALSWCQRVVRALGGVWCRAMPAERRTPERLVERRPLRMPARGEGTGRHGGPGRCGAKHRPATTAVWHCLTAAHGCSRRRSFEA